MRVISELEESEEREVDELQERLLSSDFSKENEESM
jgi:hypothetical protein